VDESWHPIAHASCSLRGAESNYNIADKECLAIVFAVGKWNSYLDEIFFEVMTDHCSLCFLASKKDLSPRLMRYSLKLQRYSFRIVYKSGKHHHDADTLSRYPLMEQADQTENSEDHEEIALCMAIKIEENNIKNLQRTDPSLFTTIQRLENIGALNGRERTRLRKYELHEGILHRLMHRPYEEQFNIVVPRSMRKEICKAYYDDILFGHASAERTYQKIIKKYYWSGMVKYINHYLSTCESCQKNKLGGKIDAPL